jgi:hypothetical protein
MTSKSQIVKFGDVDQLPAHLRHLMQEEEDWGSGQVGGFPVLSLDAKVFHIVRGEDRELITRPDDPDEAATSLGLVILRTNKGVARVFYKDKYVPGSNDAPDCYSNDGIKPAADAEDPQCKTCALCPHAQWGSRISESGKKAKACSEVKRLAVAEPGDEENPMLLRIPPTSLKNWDEYVAKLRKKGANPSMVITRIGFDHSVSHQVLTFKPVGFITDEMAEAVAKTKGTPIVDNILGQGPVVPPDEDGATDDEPAPKKKPKPKPAPVEEDEDEDEDEAPPPKKTKPAAKKPVEEDEEDEEPAPRRRRRVVAEEEPAAKKPAKKTSPLLDLDDDEEEEEAPPPKKAAKKPTVVEEDDDLEAELAGMLDELGFDDD